MTPPVRRPRVRKRLHRRFQPVPMFFCLLGLVSRSRKHKIDFILSRLLYVNRHWDNTLNEKCLAKVLLVQSKPEMAFSFESATMRTSPLKR